jgi:predicted DNA-binding protein
MRKTKYNLINMRVTDELNKRILHESKKMGLTKPSWVRQAIIKLLRDAENN